MPSRPTTFDDHDPLAQSLLHVLESFIDEIGDRGCTGHFDKVIDGNFYLKGKHLIQEPERFIEDHLVFPVLEQVLGYSIRPQPKQYAPRWPRAGGVPDFCITSISIEEAMQRDLRFFGEVKPPKKLDRACDDMVEYLDRDLDVHAIAILTDGFDWELWVRPRNQPMAETSNPYAVASLREPLRTVRTRNMATEPYQPHAVRTQIDVDGFAGFTQNAARRLIRSEFGIQLGQ
ncbi:hypothetical protein EFA46_015600 (plasmid) [Halarchaeum sp. CBA1220]|uniref:hypothetical protein n=1 Tax=Halarchaeum sp. CBA1220 TaxID=1853682 RepID=UPI000F3A9F88|nr:hypothetical protein [Halarchaeum sp. CBA1220]QLC35680.1 hypothetical protein EFA46_015600 [Halarchaeum sp. CBA1220]